MIIDTLENLPLYAHLNPRFQKVIDFLSENDINQLPEGKHLIDGEDVFVNIQMAAGKAPDVAVLETHRKMIDIQIPLSAPETYGYTPTVDLPELEYNEQKDITKYPDILAQSYITCRPGMFAVFCPQDGHAPCISIVKEFKKAIFKVKC